MSSPRHLLVVSLRVPTPDFDTASLRLEHLLDALVADGHDVTYASTQPDSFGEFVGRVPDDETRLRAKGVTVPDERDVAHHLARHGGRYDTVLTSYLEPAYLVQPLLVAHTPRAATVYDTVDIHHLRLFRTAKVTGKQPVLLRAMRAKAQEIATVANYDHTVVVSRDEQALVEQLCPGSSVSVVACPYVDVAPDAVAPLAGRDGVVFLANYLHQPNEDAMVRYVEEINPRVAALLGVAPTLRIVGSGNNPAVTALHGPGVTYVGRVPTVGPELARARVFVAPLRIGSGIKGKVVEAMAHGIPVVTTTVGAEGLGIVPGEHALVADEPDEFAAAVAVLSTDDRLWHRVSVAGLDLVRSRFSHATFRVQVRSALEMADERRRRRLDG